MEIQVEKSTTADISAAAADLYRDTPPIHRFFATYRPLLCPMREILEVFPPDSDVLDIGCGNGLLLGLLAASGRLRRGFGFDSSPSAIAAARAMALKAAQENPGARLSFELRSCADPWPSGNYPVVSLVDVMHHVVPDQQRTVFLNAVSSVRRGGLFVYKDMCRRPFWRATCNRMQDLLLARQWISYLPIGTLERWASDEGFRLVHRADLKQYCFGHELRVFQCR